MNLSELRTLLDYHYWARDRVLDAAEQLAPDQLMRNLGSSFGRCATPWRTPTPLNGRGASAGTEIADIAAAGGSLSGCRHPRAKWTALESEVRAVLDRTGEHGVDRVIAYTMINGDARQSVFWHMLQHVVNHASYHRGQVTTMLRQLGATPPQGMDLITFYRTMRPHSQASLRAAPSAR